VRRPFGGDDVIINEEQHRPGCCNRTRGASGGGALVMLTKNDYLLTATDQLGTHCRRGLIRTIIDDDHFGYASIR
jgi:galactokinase